MTSPIVYAFIGALCGLAIGLAIGVEIGRLSALRRFRLDQLRRLDDD